MGLPNSAILILLLRQNQITYLIFYIINRFSLTFSLTFIGSFPYFTKQVLIFLLFYLVYNIFSSYEKFRLKLDMFKKFFKF